MTENEILFLICCASTMAMVADGPEILQACDQVTLKLMQMNKDNAPVPDGWKPAPENIDEIIHDCVTRYKDDILLPIIKKLTAVETDDNMEEDKTTT